MFNLIYLRSQTVVNKIEYNDFYELQELYKDYMTSLGFESLEKLLNFIAEDLGIAGEKLKLIEKHLNSSDEDLDINQFIPTF